MVKAVRRAVPALALVALACGGLETPDLQHGAVVGRIQVSGSATQRPYAYVLGAPAVRADAASDGTFRLQGVPTGRQRIVVFDGDLRAESVDVVVNGESVSALDLGRPPRLAGAIEAVSSPLAAAGARGLAFSVDGTPIQEVKGDAGARLFPLPAGAFSVTATQPGFRSKKLDVAVGEGQSGSLEVHLDVEDDDEHRGCVSGGCKHGLACNARDGECYRCVTDADCGPGGTCTPKRACAYTGGGQLCAACGSASDCGGGACVRADHDGDAYCSAACVSSDACPSGYECHDGTCHVEMSCLALTATFGATCTDDDACSAALKDGKCYPPDRPRGAVGYCSAKVQAGCPAGFAADGTGYCARM